MGRLSKIGQLRVYVYPSGGFQYTIGTPIDWGLDALFSLGNSGDAPGGMLVDMATEYTEANPRYFHEFTNEHKFVVLTAPAVDEPYDDGDYNEITRLWALLEDDAKALFKARISKVAKTLIDQDVLSPAAVAMFKAFEGTFDDNEAIKQIRVKIVKGQSGSKSYISDLFGLDGYSLVDFENTVKQEIRDRLDEGKNFVGSQMTIKGLNTITAAGAGYKFTYDPAQLWGGYVDIPAEKVVSPGANELVTYLRSEEVALDEAKLETIRATRVYENGTNFGKEAVRAHFEAEWVEKKEGDWWGLFPDKPFGISDIILDYFLRFVAVVEADLEDEALDETLSELMFEQVQSAAFLVLSSTLLHYENLLRLELAKELAGLDPAQDGAKTAKDILKDAEQNADRALDGLATSTLTEEQEAISDEDIEKRQKAYKQCVLLLNYQKLAGEYIEHMKTTYQSHPWHAKGIYNGRFHMITTAGDDGEQNLVINKLKMPKATQVRSFLEMTPDIYAALQPQIKLFKVYYEDDKYVTHEIPFPSSTSTQRVDAFSNGETFDKGDGIGIKQFNFSFDGENPATSTQYVRSNLSLFFQTFGDFVKERTVTKTDGTEFTFRYLDLFVNTKFCPRSGEKSFSPLYYDPSFYRLRVDVGWAPRNDQEFQDLLVKRGFTSAQFSQALAMTNKTFYLNLIDHDININDDGTVQIEANYIAYIEGILGADRMNALFSRQAKNLQDKYVKEHEELLRKGSCSLKQQQELKASINGIADTMRKSRQRSLLSKLVLNNMLYNCKIDPVDAADYRNLDFFKKRPVLLSIAAQETQIPEDLRSDSKITQAETWSFISKRFIMDNDYQNNTKIHFFYFADLVYVLMDSLYDDAGIQRTEVEGVKLLLSSFIMDIPFSGPNSTKIDIGLIPVDIDTFNSWYKEHILDKKVEAISILDFLKRFLLYLMTNIFSEVCINQDQVKKLQFQTTNFLAVKGDDGSDVLSTYSSGQNPNVLIDVDLLYFADLLPLKTSVPNESSCDTSQFLNYLVLYPFYNPGTHSGRGERLIDENNGVYHFNIGAMKGLVKNVSFSKSDIQYVRESRMFSQGTNSLLQLSSVYRVNMKMIGNTLLYPGMEFWLNPYGFGGTEFGFPQDGKGSKESPNLSNIMGIGGYHQVLKVKSSITPGKFETEVEGHFVYSGDDTGITDKRERFVSVCEDIDAIDTAGNDEAGCRNQILKIQNALYDLGQGGEVLETVDRIDQPEEEDRSSTTVTLGISENITLTE